MDKLYLDTKEKNINIELPIFGEIRLIVQDGRVIRTETTISQKIRQSDQKTGGHEILVQL